MKLKWFEKVGIVVLIAIGCFFCGHAPLSPYSAAIPPGQIQVAHDAAGCVQACAGAAAVQVADTEVGSLCRCWAPNAFAYTFSYPDTTEKLSYARSRWNDGMRTAEKCRQDGLSWGTDEKQDNVICVKPDGANFQRRPRRRPQDPVNFVDLRTALRRT